MKKLKKQLITTISAVNGTLKKFTESFHNNKINFSLCCEKYIYCFIFILPFLLLFLLPFLSFFYNSLCFFYNILSYLLCNMNLSFASNFFTKTWIHVEAKDIKFIEIFNWAAYYPELIKCVFYDLCPDWSLALGNGSYNSNYNFFDNNLKAEITDNIYLSSSAEESLTNSVNTNQNFKNNNQLHWVHGWSKFPYPGGEFYGPLYFIDGKLGYFDESNQFVAPPNAYGFFIEHPIYKDENGDVISNPKIHYNLKKS